MTANGQAHVADEHARRRPGKGTYGLRIVHFAMCWYPPPRVCIVRDPPHTTASDDRGGRDGPLVPVADEESFQVSIPLFRTHTSHPNQTPASFWIFDT